MTGKGFRHYSLACGCILALLFIPCAIPFAKAESLVTTISSEIISIHSNFTGAEIILFGMIERDANTVTRRDGYDAVIIVRGPAQKIIVRRKERIVGIWANRESSTFIDAPSYLGVFSNRPLNKIVTDNSFDLQQQIASDPLLHPTRQDAPMFENALLRLMKKHNLYLEKTRNIIFPKPTLFISRFPLPANIPPGTYTAKVSLFSDGALLKQSTAQFQIRKSGLEQILSHTAKQQPYIYGILCVLTALVIGWGGAIIFRRD